MAAVHKIALFVVRTELTKVVILFLVNNQTYITLKDYKKRYNLSDHLKTHWLGHKNQIA